MYMYGHKRHSKTVFKSRRSFIFLKWLILFLISSPCKEYYMYISYSVFGKRLLHVNYMYSWPGFMECKRKCTRAYLSRAKMTPPPPLQPVHFRLPNPPFPRHTQQRFTSGYSVRPHLHTSKCNSPKVTVPKRIACNPVLYTKYIHHIHTETTSFLQWEITEPGGHFATSLCQYYISIPIMDLWKTDFNIRRNIRSLAYRPLTPSTCFRKYWNYKFSSQQFRG